jgi:NAD(P)-dependent dehydrogenase (short-subunit alcohol dehydrogenase family)
MNRESIIRGIARWYGKAIVPRLVRYGATKAVSVAAVNLAETNPAVAEKLVMSAVPAAATKLVDAIVASPESFEEIVAALRASVEKEGVRFSVKEVGLEGFMPPHQFTLDAEEFDRIVESIRGAYAESHGVSAGA